MQKKIAVITGASSGIGKMFAETVGEYGTFDEVWVIARRIDRLESLNLPFPTRAIALDLSKEESYKEYEELLKTENPDISLDELGKMMNPELSRSAVSRRFKKLEKIAAELKTK